MNFIMKIILTFIVALIVGLLYYFIGFEDTVVTILCYILVEVLFGDDKL